MWGMESPRASSPVIGGSHYAPEILRMLNSTREEFFTRYGRPACTSPFSWERGMSGCSSPTNMHGFAAGAPRCAPPPHRPSPHTARLPARRRARPSRTGQPEPNLGSARPRLAAAQPAPRYGAGRGLDRPALADQACPRAPPPPLVAARP